MGNDYVDLNEPCNLNCTNQNLTTFIGNEKPAMTCVDKMLNYKLCTVDKPKIQEIAKETQLDKCVVCIDFCNVIAFFI